MSKPIKILLSVWAGTVVFFSGLTGFIVHRYDTSNISSVNNIPVTLPIVENKIDRPKDFTPAQCEEKLYHYDHDNFIMHYTVVNQKTSELNVNVKGSLYERDFKQDVCFPIKTESGNWKLGLGIAIGAGVAAGTGLLIYKLRK